MILTKSILKRSIIEITIPKEWMLKRIDYFNDDTKKSIPKKYTLKEPTPK